MPNAKDIDNTIGQNILVIGSTGSGKTSQIWTLPGKKFVYVFDPNALASLRGCDCDYEVFLPDTLELDATLKGFNKGARSDTIAGSRREPTTYVRWVEDLNERVESGFFDDYDWLCFDSLTFLQKTVMDRQLYINGRYGKVEELADYRVVGSKLSDVFRSITALAINCYYTGHLREFQDEKTKKITTELMLPGQAKAMIPIAMTNIWLAKSDSEGKKTKYVIQTRAERRGLQCIRSSIRGLDPEHDVTISDFDHAKDYGIGKILTEAQ